MTSPEEPVHPPLLPVSRMEALEWAKKWADDNKIFDIPLKPNGYPVDGFKPLDQHERLFELKCLAEWVLEGKDVDDF